MSDEINVRKSPEQDAEDNKAYGIVAYIIFFIPLLVAKESKFAMYHANQGLILLILSVLIGIAGNTVPLLGALLISPLGSIFCFVLLVIGILNAAKGEMKPLPLIGNFEILK